MNRTLIVSVLLLASTAVFSQTPYAGMQARPIKALSEQQVADLVAGRGMGLALAAELNGHPGPSHVLELADKLELTADQRSSVKALFDSMKAEALPLGSKLIEQEADLDRQFASHTVTPESLKASTAAVAVNIIYRRPLCYRPIKCSVTPNCAVMGAISRCAITTTNRQNGAFARDAKRSTPNRLHNPERPRALQESMGRTERA